MKLALAQLQIEGGETDANRDRALSAIREAAGRQRTKSRSIWTFPTGQTR